MHYSEAQLYDVRKNEKENRQTDEQILWHFAFVLVNRHQF